MGKKLLHIFLVLILPIGLFAQSEFQNLRFFHHKHSNGLSQSKIKGISQDNLGYMWFGTEAGLNKFNSSEYEIFSKESKGEHFLPFDNINNVISDLHGNIWFSIEGAGLAYYNQRTEKITRFFNNLEVFTEDPGFSIDNQYIGDIAVDHENSIYILTGNLLFILKSNKNFQFQIEKHSLPQNEDGSANTTTSLRLIKLDTLNQAWIASENGRLFLFSDNHFKDFTQEINRNSPEPIKSISALTFDEDGRLIIGTLSQGIFIWDVRNKTVDHIPVRLNESFNAKNNRVSSLCFLNKDNLWIGTWGFGLLIYHLPSKSFKRFVNENFYEESLANNYVSEIYRDRNYNMWVGTSDGVDLATINPVTNLKNDFTRYGLNDNDVLSVLEAENGTVWVGTRNGGLNKIDPITGIVHKYQHEETNPNSIADNTIESLLIDRNGNLWIGTRNGLDLLKPGTQTFLHFIHDPENANSIPFNIINHIMQDSIGNIWLATDGGGVSRISPDLKNFTNYSNDPQKPNSLSNKVTRMTHEDHLGNIWIGTYLGLNKLNQDGKTFTVYVPVIGDTSSLSNSGCVSLYTDSHENLWVGTYGGGLNKFNYADQSFTSFQKKDGLSGNFIYSIHEDIKGNLWVSTESGLSKIKFNATDNTITTTNFDSNFGFSDNAFSYASFYNKEEDIMCLGSKSGLDKFKTSELYYLSGAPQVIVSSLKILNQKVLVGDKFGILNQSLATTKEIDIPYGHSILSFDFHGIDYLSNNKINYYYQLKPLINEWNNNGKIATASLTNLDPGTYTLLVKAINIDTNVESITEELIIHIIPPFWKTIWFKILVFAFTLVMIYSMYRTRVRFLRKSNIELERKVEIRTHDLNAALKDIQEKKEEIETQNEEMTAQFDEIINQRDQIQEINEKLESAHHELKIVNEGLDERVKVRTAELLKINQELDRFVYSASHDLSAPLKSILGLVNIAKYENKNKALTSHLEFMEKSVGKLEDVIKSLTQFSRNMGHEVVYKNILFDKLIEDILEELKIPFHGENVKIVRSYASQDVIYTDILRIKIILSNLISNALKYRKDGRKPIVKIGFHKNETLQHISIEDNGIGIDKESIPKVFEMFYRATDLSHGSGLGLYIVRETLQKLNGNISLESEPDKFTIFKLAIPLIK